MFISFVLMFGLAAVAEPMIVTLIGKKWLPSVPYLQLLCFVGMLYPLHALNIDMLNIKGRPDLPLKLEIIKKLLAVPTIVIGILVGIKTMILGMIGISLISYYLNSYWSGKMVDYPIKEQITDLMPSFTIAVIMGVVVFFVGHWLPLKPMIVLIAQLVIGAIVTLSIARLFRIGAFMEISEIVSGRFRLALDKS
jgi:O-antigen/teichoic acid export membrane protein